MNLLATLNPLVYILAFSIQNCLHKPKLH